MNIPLLLRKADRSTCWLSVRYFGNDLLGSGTLWDLSKQGGRLTGNRPVSVQDELLVYAHLPEDLGEHWVSLGRAKVRWQAGNNFGVEFLLDQPDSRKYLAYILGDFTQD